MTPRRPGTATVEDTGRAPRPAGGKKTDRRRKPEEVDGQA
jgi:hypothetical protein